MKLKLYYADGGNHPVLGKVYHQCQDMFDGDDVARYQRYLANTLSGIAQTPSDCDLILASVKKLESEQGAEFLIEGNDIDITVSKMKIQVDINVNDDWVDNPEGGGGARRV